MPENFIAVSISHHRAPVEVRERLQLSEEEMRALLGKLEFGEALILSTCNRTELYAGSSEDTPVESHALIRELLAAKELDNSSHPSHESYFEILHSKDAIRHLFAVIAGIDSQIIGDQQIFAQVKDAFRISAEAGATGSFLNKLSQAAFHVAKRVITETTLNEGAGTISYAAVELARKIYDDLRSRHILVIGAGETGELAAKHFIERGALRITIANRSIEKAHAMLDRVNPEHIIGSFNVIPLAALEEVLPGVDIIISATSAPDYVLTEPAMKSALEKRESSAPVVMIDIAVPRDIDPAIASLSNVFLKDIDDLRTIVDRNAERRRQEIPKAEAIIEEEFARFLESLSTLEAGPTIKELREKFEAVRKEELDRNRGKLDDRSFALMDDMTRRMMNRLLHQPTISLKETNGEASDQLTRIQIARKLFGLDKGNE
ncbi:MAG TPA: glutamyl-tRNA reductase [Candidatus Kapabacteria bacterium]|nr:glutamyl-tRNA reductase [Candidatus Kapabacteria bacterium]